MKASISSNGILTIKAKSGIENFALKTWFNRLTEIDCPDIFLVLKVEEYKGDYKKPKKSKKKNQTLEEILADEK